jgi:TPR repeat protein
MSLLASIHYQGPPDVADLSRALFWANRAGKAGHKQAQDLLDRQLRVRRPRPCTCRCRTHSRALQAAGTAARAGHAPAASDSSTEPLLTRAPSL